MVTATALADLRRILLDLGFDNNQLQSWPPNELFIRWDGSFPSRTLSKFRLLPMSSSQISERDKEALVGNDH
jgi:hypothetical protein